MKQNVWELKPRNVSDDDFKKSLQMLKDNTKISAIKLIRDASGLGLKESKDIVDEIDASIKSGARTEQNAVVLVTFKDKTEKYYPGCLELTTTGFVRIQNIYINANEILEMEVMDEDIAKLKHLDTLK
jgi:hypothetical protein